MLTQDQYAEKFTTAQNDLLQEILRHTLQTHPAAHMISGHVQGQFLSMISKIVRPRRILEIGTFTGFSALCLAEGLAEDGLLYTLELRDADADTVELVFELR